MIDYSKKEIKLLGNDLVSLYGIEFTIKEGSTEGYFRLEEISERNTIDTSFIENILIKYRLIDKNDEFEDDEIKIIFPKPTEDFPDGFIKTYGTVDGFIVIAIAILKDGIDRNKEGCFFNDDNYSYRGLVYNEEFVLKLIKKDRESFESFDQQRIYAKKIATELIINPEELFEKQTVLLTCFNEKCNHNFKKKCCKSKIELNLKGKCLTWEARV
jgi:hypothetical protein